MQIHPRYLWTLEGETGEQRKVVVLSLDDGGLQGLKTVATKSFGIRCLVNKEPKIANMIKRDTVLPIEYTDTFSTARANMKSVDIKIFQNESYEDVLELDDGVNVGKGVLEGLPDGLPEGAPFELTIRLAENGLLEITGAYNGTPLQGKVEQSVEEFTGQQ